jgi:hypothetical protein
MQTHLELVSHAYFAENYMNVALPLVWAPGYLCPKSKQTPLLRGRPVDGVETGRMGAADEVHLVEATSFVH